MEYVDNLYNSLSRRITFLESAGQYKDNDNRSLLIYLFLVNDMLNGPLSEYLDDNGLAVINRVLSCLREKSCLDIPRTTAGRLHTPTYGSTSLRLTETSNPRKSEEQDLRSGEP